MARIDLDGASGEVLTAVGPIELLSSEEIDAAEARGRLDAERSRLGDEIGRLERKLGNDGFIAKAPAEVVEAEREKLAGYRAELEELG